MALGKTTDTDGFAAGWDWKGNYVDGIGGGDGLERFSQGSVTPDTTLLFAGPARFGRVAANPTSLAAIGLVNSFQFQSNASVQPLYEIGSNRTFFTRGKTQNSINLGTLLADKASLGKVLLEAAYEGVNVDDSNYDLNISGSKAPGQGDLHMNLDSEAFNIPFGIMMVFKTKGQRGGTDLNGQILGATYLENCMLMGLNFSVDAQAPVIQEGASIMYDRAVPVQVA